MEKDQEGDQWSFTPLAIPARPVSLQVSGERTLEGPTSPRKTRDALAAEPLQREARFEQLLQEPTIDVGKTSLSTRAGPIDRVEVLKRLSWKGIPPKLRAAVWRVLVGYLPNITSRHAFTLERKRNEYRDIVSQHFGPSSRRDESIMHQIAIDVPRTAPESVLFKNPFIRESLARVLYCWSIRRPASGYVQGINDLVTPFYQVFVDELIPMAESNNNVEPDPTDAAASQTSTAMVIRISESLLRDIEADIFWCFSLLLDGIQDNYTFNQSGISRQLLRMREIVQRTDPKLLGHLDVEGITFIQFAFRWINCLLIREFPLHMVVRMWDTYLAEGDGGFSSFHIFVCAAFLCRWSDRLQILEFQDMLLFLQNPPTASWSLEDLEMLLSEAFMWKTVFEGSLDHLQSSQ